MNCAFCCQNIDDDSFYCDQCGKEVLLCPTCGKTGKGKFCVIDKSVLVVAKNRTITQGTPQQPDFAAISTPTPISKPKGQSSNNITSNIQTIIPKLKLVNNNLKINLEIYDGDIIGRTTGQHVQIFSQFQQISGKHLQFRYDSKKGWLIIDLGSTNGTAVANNTNWKSTPKINAHHPLQIAQNTFVLIANIELQILQEQPVLNAPTGTQRI